MKKAFRKLSSKCPASTHPIGQLLTNQIFLCIYVPRCPLPNGENRRSLAISVLELFNSQSRAFFFGTDSSASFVSDLKEKEKKIYILFYSRIINSYRILDAKIYDTE